MCECLDGVDYDIVVDSFPKGNARDYKYIDGEYVYSPEPKDDPAEPVEYATYEELAAAIQEGVNSYGK